MPQTVISKWVPVLNTTQRIPARAKAERSPSELLPIEQPTPAQPAEPAPVPESTFDDLAGLASHICEAPLGCISLAEAGRQWFKVQGELPEQEQQRDLAFCSEARLNGEILEVPDATRDERFASNALVSAEPPIRFFAGAPLLAGKGEVLGTLCVVDHKSHTLSAEQKEALKTVSRQVITQLELRRINAGTNGDNAPENKDPDTQSEPSSDVKETEKIKVEGRCIAVFRSVEQNGVCHE
jgi:hypothetical protein